MKFEFATAQRILFGEDTLDEVGTIARGFGRRAVVVIGSKPERMRRLLSLLDAAGMETTLISIRGEPTVEIAAAGVEIAREFAAEVVVAAGGGSVIDAAKAIAALTTNPGDIFDYLEVIGGARPLLNASLPVIAIPTTAGTGSEVTRNAVLASPKHRVKVSVRSATMLPRVALVDPVLTYTVPPDVTAYTGLDALTQLIEPFVSIRANPMTDALCRDGMHYAARSLQRAVLHGNDADARRNMAFASLCGGIALANAGLGAVHGFAGPFGGMYDAPHGAICAVLLPEVCAANIQALRKRAPNRIAMRRYAELATILTGSPEATIEDALAWLRSLVSAFDIPPLSYYGFGQADAPTLIAKARVASSMKANPLVLLEDELAAILRAAA